MYKVIVPICSIDQANCIGPSFNLITGNENKCMPVCRVQNRVQNLIVNQTPWQLMKL